MTVSVKQGSVQLVVVTDPTGIDPELRFHTDTKSKVVVFDTKPITLFGRATLVGQKNDDLGGWTLGWIQVLKEENWGIYQGRSQGDGSMRVVRAGQSGKKPWHVCRDTFNKGNILVELNKDMPAAQFRIPGWKEEMGPLSMMIALTDPPGQMYQLELKNSKTGKPNFLREVKLTLDFYTVLTLMDPRGNPQHLKHIFWQAHWHSVFGVPDKGEKLAMWHDIAVGTHNPIRDGAPTDPVFARLLTGAKALNCHQLSEKGFRSPVPPEESKLRDTYKPTREP